MVPFIWLMKFCILWKLHFLCSTSNSSKILGYGMNPSVTIVLILFLIIIGFKKFLIESELNSSFVNILLS